MPFTVEVDAAGVLKQLDALTKNIGGLEQQMPVEFFNWQAEDMHRHYPKVEDAGNSASTLIHPRSTRKRSRLKARLKSLVGGGQPVRRRVVIRRPAVVGAHRPILRPELYELLKKRMHDMLMETAKWR